MRQDSGIGVLDKAVGVLHAVADSPCGLAELCERTGLPRATAHRLAAGLEVHRLLTRDPQGRWQLGIALTELATRVHDPLLAAGAAVLPRLREITGESVQLYRRDGAWRICVAALEPPAGLRDTVPVGTRLPMNAGSGAKVLLAHSDSATIEAVLPGAKFTGRTLAEVRRRGWAQSAAEREPGVASVSAPVRDAGGTVIAAISVSGPIDRMGRRPGERWATDLVARAEIAPLHSPHGNQSALADRDVRRGDHRIRHQQPHRDTGHHRRRRAATPGGHVVRHPRR